MKFATAVAQALLAGWLAMGAGGCSGEGGNDQRKSADPSTTLGAGQQNRVTPGQVVQSTTQAATMAGGYMAQETQSFLRTTNQRLDSVAADLARWKAIADRQGQAGQQQYQQFKTDLDAKSQALRQDLQRFQAAGQETWRTALDKANATLKDLNTAYSAAAARYQATTRPSAGD